MATKRLGKGLEALIQGTSNKPPLESGVMPIPINTVSYTHLTLPTILRV